MAAHQLDPVGVYLAYALAFAVAAVALVLLLGLVILCSKYVRAYCAWTVASATLMLISAGLISAPPEPKATFWEGAIPPEWERTMRSIHNLPVIHEDERCHKPR